MHRAHDLAVAAALLWMSACTASPQRGSVEEQAAFAAAVDLIAEDARARRSIPGLSIVITRGDQVVLAKGYGTADLDSGALATPRTVYQIGSISKQFTAAAILLLGERGEISLDDRISEILPDLSAEWRDVRLRHLLHQTSGVPDFLFLPEFAAQASDLHRSAAELRAIIARQPLQFLPGERWSYSNSNYTLLAAAIERITGEPYDRFLEREFFRPLGLGSIHHCAPLPTAPDHARGYGLRDGSVTAAPPENMNWARGDGGLCANAGDLARWARALAAGRIISPSSYQRMTTADPVRDGTAPSYGFGLSLVDLAGRRKVAHHGAMTGFTGMLAHYPGEDLVIAVLTNRGGIWADAIEKAIARKALGLPPPDVRALPLSAEEARGYEGTYDLGAFQVRIVRREGRLWIETPPPAPTSPLLFQGEGTLVAETDPDAIQLVFEPLSSGGRRLILSMAGMHWYGNLRRELSSRWTGSPSGVGRRSIPSPCSGAWPCSGPDTP